MNWMNQHVSFVILLLTFGVGTFLLVTGQLQYKPGGDQATEFAEEAAPSGQASPRAQGNKVVLDQDTYTASGIRVIAVSKGPVSISFQAPGEVQLAEDRVAHVTPLIAGVVRSLYKGVGDRVEKGSPLCLIESVELGDAKAAYVTAQAEVGIAEDNYRRFNLLFEKGLRTQNELIAVEAELTRAQLRVDAALARLRGLGVTAEEIQALEQAGAEGVSNQYTLRSPINGSILQRNVTDGQSVAPSDQLFFVGDLSEVWVQTAVREQDLPTIRLDMAARIRPANLSEVLFQGRVTYIGEQVDEKSRTVPVRILVRNVALPNSPQNRFLLRPGLFTNVEIETGRRRDVLKIPFAALQFEGSGAFVFVEIPNTGQQGSENQISSQTVTFERRTVEVGIRNGEMIEISKGLQLGEHVAVENAYLLKGELEKSTLEED